MGSKDKHGDGVECNIFKSFRRNQNQSFMGVAGYEGIPQNFLMNIAVWLVMVLGFTLLRKKAWNYGRISVMQKEEIKWTDMFYEDREGEVLKDEVSSTERGPVIIATAKSSYVVARTKKGPVLSNTYDIQVPVSSFGLTSIPQSGSQSQASYLDEFDDDESGSDIVEEESDQTSTANPKVHVLEILDRGYFSWIKIVFSLTDEQFKEKCGQDCVHYLSFLRHLMCLAAIMTVVSMGIILPINLRRSIVHNDYTGFADTTIINVHTEHHLLWAHVIIGNLFLVISVVIMRRFSERLHFTEKDDCHVSRTVIITGISKGNTREDYLRDHFAEAYPDSEISEISFAYDICKLQEVEQKRLSAISAKLYYLEKLQGNGASQGRPKLRPYLCGVCNCTCWGRCQEMDAIEYYTEQEQHYEREVEVERERVVSKPFGIAFVTFKSIASATRVVESSGFLTSLFLHAPVSQYSRRLNTKGWSVKYAPPPQAIYWENLNMNIKFWYLKFFVVNVLLTILVTIFTTPVYLFTTVVGPEIVQDQLGKKVNVAGANGTSEVVTVDHITVLVALIIDTLPIIIVCTLGVVLVLVVSMSDIIIGFWSKTAATYSEMVKTFFFLTFMVIALPSLGITSFSYFIMDSHMSLSWSCIFYKENGALFVNYLITSSLIGTGAELIRIPELLLLVLKLCMARSKAEIGSIRKSVLLELPLGAFYSWIMLEFAILACFCVIYPLVTPFGLIYLGVKYWTDRYNIYFAHAPCKVDKHVHRTAINFVMICMFMLQINLVAYVHFHLGEGQNEQSNLAEATSPDIRALQIFTLVTFSLAASVFIGQACCNVCGDFSPIHHLNDLNSLKNFDLEIRTKEENEENQAVSEATTAEEGEDELQMKSGDPIQMATRGEEGDTGDAMERRPPPVATNPNSTAKRRRPYGRYIPPLLRPEFIRLTRAADPSAPTHPHHPHRSNTQEEELQLEIQSNETD